MLSSATLASAFTPACLALAAKGGNLDGPALSCKVPRVEEPCGQGASIGAITPAFVSRQLLYDIPVCGFLSHL